MNNEVVFFFSSLLLFMFFPLYSLYETSYIYRHQSSFRDLQTSCGIFSNMLEQYLFALGTKPSVFVMSHSPLPFVW
jgi:hypothetical protein